MAGDDEAVEHDFWGTPQRCIVALAKSDEFDPPPTQDDVVTIAKELSVDRVVLTSAMKNDGIGNLFETIVGSVAWENATSFPSLDAFELIIKSLDEVRANGRYLTSTRELYDGFKRAHPYALRRVAGEDPFRDGIQLLEVLGHLELFYGRDEIVLDPTFYHAYT